MEKDLLDQATRGTVRKKCIRHGPRDQIISFYNSKKKLCVFYKLRIIQMFLKITVFYLISEGTPHIIYNIWEIGFRWV